MTTFAGVLFILQMFMRKSKQSNAKIEVTKDGPYLVSGDLPLSEPWIVTDAEGGSLDYPRKRNTRHSRNIHSAVAVSRPINPSVAALTRKFNSTARKPPVINPIQGKPKPMKVSATLLSDTNRISVFVS
jgi:hypothetical protein